MSEQWEAEDIFIQLIVDNSPVTLLDLEYVKYYLEARKKNIIMDPYNEFTMCYNKWKKARDKCLLIMSSKTPINYFTYKSIVDENELNDLKDKILYNELELIDRTSNVVYNEIIHQTDRY